MPAKPLAGAGGSAVGGDFGKVWRPGERMGASTMRSVRAPALLIRSGINAASGRLRQYFCGISLCIALILSRAGLKMLL